MTISVGLGLFQSSRTKTPCRPCYWFRSTNNETWLDIGARCSSPDNSSYWHIQPQTYRHVRVPFYCERRCNSKSPFLFHRRLKFPSLSPIFMSNQMISKMVFSRKADYMGFMWWVLMNNANDAVHSATEYQIPLC